MKPADAEPGPLELRADRDRQLFDAIAERYCRKDLLPASRRARRHRLDQTLRRVPMTATTRVLEVGCGAGFGATYLRGRYGRYVGLDPSERLLGLARSYNAGPKASFYCSSLDGWESDECFDGIFMIGVLHHIEDRDPSLRRAVGLLEPGGWLAVNEPQPANPLIRLARRVRKRVHADYSDEQDEMSATDLVAAFERAGLRRVRISAQGLLSTPFAEVVLQPQWAMRWASELACRLDAMAEATPGGWLGFASWNLVAVGYKEASPSSGPARMT